MLLRSLFLSTKHLLTSTNTTPPPSPLACALIPGLSSIHLQYCQRADFLQRRDEEKKWMSFTFRKICVYSFTDPDATTRKQTNTHVHTPSHKINRINSALHRPTGDFQWHNCDGLSACVRMWLKAYRCSHYFTPRVCTVVLCSGVVLLFLVCGLCRTISLSTT